jgi:hypothetical protein
MADTRRPNLRSLAQLGRPFAEITASIKVLLIIFVSSSRNRGSITDRVPTPRPARKPIIPKGLLAGHRVQDGTRISECTKTRTGFREEIAMREVAQVANLQRKRRITQTWHRK